MVRIRDFVKDNDFLSRQDTGGYSTSPPQSQTASSHSISIRNERGLKIGRIQNWSPSMSRVIDSEFENDANSAGEPVERVPQIQSGNRISVDRYELYTFHIGQAFGTPVVNQDRRNGDLVSLSQQVRPIGIREIWRDPFGAIRAYAYVGVWFSDLGLTISATDDRIIKARATLEFTRRIRLQ